jgi:hypothetical protein
VTVGYEKSSCVAARGRIVADERLLYLLEITG